MFAPVAFLFTWKSMTGNQRGNELYCAIASNLCNPSQHTMKHTELVNRENSLERQKEVLYIESNVCFHIIMCQTIIIIMTTIFFNPQLSLIKPQRHAQNIQQTQRTALLVDSLNTLGTARTAFSTVHAVAQLFLPTLHFIP